MRTVHHTPPRAPALRRREMLAVLAILVVAGVFRGWLIAGERVSFDSDEAIMGLMARHINQGEPVPTFYYGQAYMGSLDALLTAAGFRLFGESVTAIRLVQFALYMLSLVAAYALARTVTRRPRVAAMALLLLAIPTPLGALYTTLTLGGYNEIVLLGSLILLLGWQVTVDARRDSWRWVALGALAGIGWWTNGAIITVIAVVGLMGLWHFDVHRWPLYVLAALAFLAGSAPWWLYNLRHDWEAASFLTGGFSGASGTETATPLESFIGLIALGLPALYGLRYTWEPGPIMSLGSLAAALVYLALVTDALARHREKTSLRPGPAGSWLWLVFGVFTLTFTFSSFSDATGRYLMPLWTPAAIGLAFGLDRLRRAGRLAAALPLGLLLAFQAGAVIRAAQSDVGLQPQLIERLQTPAEYDQDVIDFLQAENLTRGYAGYWTSYRLIFRSHEALILDTALPYHEDGYLSGNNRYPPYRDIVAQADRTAWITQNFPELDALIEARLRAAGITFQVRSFGPYRVYYAFSERVTPANLSLMDERPLAEWSRP